MENTFALEQLRAKRLELFAAVTEMNLQHEKLCEKYSQKCHDRLERLCSQAFFAMRGIQLCLEELDQSRLALYSSRLGESLAMFQVNLRDYSKLNQTMSAFDQMLTPFVQENDQVNAAVIGRMMNRVKLGFYPTAPDHIPPMKNALVFPSDTTVNLLDPCCGCGDALFSLAKGKNALTFGAELDKARAERAIRKLNRVAIGSYYFSRISVNAFHVLFLNPPYLTVNGARAEKRFLANSYRHLLMGGILLYIVPYYRLDLELCSFLSTHFTDLQIFRFRDAEFKKFRQVLVIGRRKPAAEDPEEAKTLLAYACAPELIPPIDRLPEGSYEIPQIPKAVALFRGEEFNEQELAEELAKAGSILQKQSGLDGGDKRPPLPLTISQIGLIGGSGLINGLIDCDTPHIIKGRIIKSQTTEKEALMTAKDEAYGEHVRETHSSKMIFNLLTADGFQTLT
ncbi:class I SAM-dependent methyltransferase [Butyricicoccus sp. 1XD8-22]|nr:class I SAM-dependent methyltransferase [Butyricicoccus sp. 1XD8-22]